MPDSPALPASLRWAVGILLGEAAGVAVIAAILGYEDLTAEATDVRAALFVTLYAVAMAVVLALLGFNLAKRRAWPRGPAIALQLIMLLPAYNMIRGGLAWVGVPIAGLAVAVIVLLVTPAVREALGIR